MKALISKNETIKNFDMTYGFRIVQVSDAEFEIAKPLFWADCEKDCIADEWYYDANKNECLPKPIEQSE
jgi:hypothetical protein